MRALALAICVVSLTLFPHAANAGKSKVAILKIEDDSGAEVQGALKEALADEFKVASFKDTAKAWKALALEDEPTDKDFGKLAESLEVEVVVAGKLEGKGDAKNLRVRLYVKGHKSKKFSVQFGSAKSEKFKRTMHSTLVDKIAAINRSGEEEEEPKTTKKTKKGDEEDETKALKTMKTKKGDEEEPKTTKKKKGAEAEEEEEEEETPLPKSKKKKKVAVDEDGNEIEESSEEEPGTLKASPHAANRAAVRVDAGISASSRILDFNARTYDQAPIDYKNAIVPAVRVAAELYPLAFADPKGRGAGLGLWGDYDKTVSLTLQTRDANGMIVAAKALQQHYSIGGGYRFAFTKSDLSPTFTIGINYARQTFIAGQPAGVTLDLPNTDYTMFQPLARLRIPFAKPVALFGEGRGMLITNAGAITTGDQYGQAKVFGVMAMGGLDFIVSNRFAVRVMGEFSQIGFTFTKGAGVKANNRDGDPNTKDVFGAADRSMGGSVTLGVLY